MAFHINTKVDGKFEYSPLVKHGAYHVSVVCDGLLQGVLTRKSERKIKVALVRSYVSEYRPGTRVHFLTLHSSRIAAIKRMEDCPSSDWTIIHIDSNTPTK